MTIRAWSLGCDGETLLLADDVFRKKPKPIFSFISQKKNK